MKQAAITIISALIGAPILYIACLYLAGGKELIQPALNIFQKSK